MPALFGGNTVEKQKGSVWVGGKEYTLVSSDTPEYMQRVAAYADRVLRETAMATRLPTAQANIMAMITLADEVMKAQDENTRLRRELRALRERLGE